MLLSQDDIRSLMAEKAQADLRKTQVPSSAEAYTATLPPEFKLPEGMAWQFDTNSPAYIDARAWAHRNGLTQSQWSEALSFFASTQIAEHQSIAAAAQRELAKLGPMPRRGLPRSRRSSAESWATNSAARCGR
jgi:hypothetical protein